MAAIKEFWSVAKITQISATKYVIARQAVRLLAARPTFHDCNSHKQFALVQKVWVTASSGSVKTIIGPADRARLPASLLIRLRCFGRTKPRGVIAARNSITFDIVSSFASSMESGSSEGATMLKETDVEAALANCRALINQIKAGLSAGEPFVDVSSAAELLFYLECAASALKGPCHAPESVRRRRSPSIITNGAAPANPSRREQMCSRPAVG